MRLQRAIAEAILHAHDTKEAIMKKRFVIHPFLFGLFFVLGLYSANVDEVSFSQVVVPMLVVIAGTTVILLLAWLLPGKIGRAALLAPIAVILCFSCGHVVNLVAKTPGVGFNLFIPPNGLAILIWLAWAFVFVASSDLDRYAGASTIEETCDFDSSEFIDTHVQSTWQFTTQPSLYLNPGVPATSRNQDHKKSRRIHDRA
jgi:hypothetical protein